MGFQDPCLVAEPPLAPTASWLSVLVLDDNQFDLLRISRMISACNIDAEVVPCADLDQLAEVLSSQDIDIAVIDNRLGAHSGADAMRMIKAHENLGPVPAIMVAGDTSPEDIVASVRSGCRDFLGKSGLTAEKLERAIEKVLTEACAEHLAIPEAQVATLSRKVLGGVTSTCIAELDPIARRMYRQLSFIRGCVSHNALPSMDAINEIEADILRIRRFLDDLEHHERSFMRLQ